MEDKLDVTINSALGALAEAELERDIEEIERLTALLGRLHESYRRVLAGSRVPDVEPHCRGDLRSA